MLNFHILQKTYICSDKVVALLAFWSSSKMCCPLNIRNVSQTVLRYANVIMMVAMIFAVAFDFIVHISFINIA